MASESAYQEFTGKSVEEALKIACETFKVGLADLDFEIIAPGSKGVLGMGAEPARIVAAPASAIAGSAPKRSTEPAPRAAAPRAAAPRDAEPREAAPREAAPRAARPERSAAPRAERPARAPRPERAPREEREPRERRERSETTPEMIAGGKEILETLIKHLDFEAEIRLSGEGSETVLNVAGTSPEAVEELGSLIGRRGERLQAIQHLVNLMLSRKLGEWARVTVDIEEYRGRREAQLRALARKAGERVRETGRAVQLEPMTALERRWVHMELQGAPGIATESAGEEPERRVVVIPA
ncbi:MAG: Jag N-terminal domain-containing protein [Chloroflexi bacterium]|jgi:spoIIIJ-associated protein|nr:Jag N-terminal domain-containing protein [Chloroflexota bacterium]